jgi:hypothetical protein
MPNRVERRCRECGVGLIVPSSKIGCVEIHVCNKCGAEWIDGRSSLEDNKEKDRCLSCGRLNCGREYDIDDIEDP